MLSIRPIISALSKSEMHFNAPTTIKSAYETVKVISDTRLGSLRGEKHSQVLTLLAHEERPPFSLQQSSQLLPFQLNSLPRALAAPLFLQLRQGHAEHFRPRTFKILCGWWIKKLSWDFRQKDWSKRRDAAGYEFFHFLQDRRI